jgi:hypothetical protein
LTPRREILDVAWDLARDPGHYLVIQEIDRILATA